MQRTARGERRVVRLILAVVCAATCAGASTSALTATPAGTAGKADAAQSGALPRSPATGAGHQTSSGSRGRATGKPASAAGRSARRPAASPALDDSMAALARVNLLRHVDSARLLAFRDTCGANEAAALDFLFAWLPSSDLAAWRADQLIDDLTLAFQTRRDAPWRDQIDDPTFRTYVLPPRSAQEPIQPWRRRLHDLLWDRVKDKTLHEAALEVNRFCREYATFIPTSDRDQGPLTTMDRGLGRCEEETIFYIAAARSVGIPARPCYTPWWTACDNNHAWVEVFVGDGWHYLGACEPAADLDSAWFTGPVRRAGLVLSVAYGENDGTAGPPHGKTEGNAAYSHGFGTTLINSTGVYTTPGDVTVEWADINPAKPTSPAGRPTGHGASVPPASLYGGHVAGAPSDSLRGGHAARASSGSLRDGPGAGAPSDSLRAARDTTRIHVSVFNSGALMELGSFQATRGIRLGPGDYVASSEVHGVPIAALVTVRPGQTTRLRLDPNADEEARIGWLEQPFWLRIPDPSRPSAANPQNATVSAEKHAATESNKAGAVSQNPSANSSKGKPKPAAPGADGISRDLVQRTNELAVARHDLERARTGRIDSKTVLEIAARELQGSQDEHRVQDLAQLFDHLQLGGVHAPAWAAFLSASKADTFGAARDLLLRMDDKDFFECDTSSARLALREAYRVRAWRRAAKATGAEFPDSIWAGDVLCPRIGDQPGSFALFRDLPLCVRSDTATAQETRLDPATLARTPESPRRILSLFARRMHAASPTRLGHIATPSESWASGWANPAAARVALIGLFRRNGIPARLDAEQRWVEAWTDSGWVPMRPLDAASWNRRTGAVAEAYETPARLDVSFTDLGAPMLSAAGWTHFTLERLVHGRFLPVDLDFPVSEGRLSMPIEPGDYWLFGGQRNHSGDPRIQGRRFHAETGKTTSFDVDLGIPPAEWETEDLAPRSLPDSTRDFLVRAMRSPGGQATPGKLLVFAWAPGSEPCRRTSDALQAGARGLTGLGLAVVSLEICPDSTGSFLGSATADLSPAWSNRRIRFQAGQTHRLLGVDVSQLPVVALIGEDGRTLLWLEGMQLAAGDLIRRSLEGGK